MYHSSTTICIPNFVETGNTFLGMDGQTDGWTDGHTDRCSLRLALSRQLSEESTEEHQNSSHTLCALSIGYVMVWSPPILNSLHPVDRSLVYCRWISLTASGTLYIVKFTSPASATSNASYGEAPGISQKEYTQTNFNSSRNSLYKSCTPNFNQ